MDNNSNITNVLPKNGLVYSERGGLGEVLCKPKILPLKSSVLLKLKQQAELEEEQLNNIKNDDNASAMRK